MGKGGPGRRAGGSEGCQIKCKAECHHPVMAWSGKADGCVTVRQKSSCKKQAAALGMRQGQRWSQFLAIGCNAKLALCQRRASFHVKCISSYLKTPNGKPRYDKSTVSSLSLQRDLVGVQMQRQPLLAASSAHLKPLLWSLCCLSRWPHKQRDSSLTGTHSWSQHLQTQEGTCLATLLVGSLATSQQASPVSQGLLRVSRCSVLTCWSEEFACHLVAFETR